MRIHISEKRLQEQDSIQTIFGYCKKVQTLFDHMILLVGVKGINYTYMDIASDEYVLRNMYYSMIMSLNQACSSLQMSSGLSLVEYYFMEIADNPFCIGSLKKRYCLIQDLYNSELEYAKDCLSNEYNVYQSNILNMKKTNGEVLDRCRTIADCLDLEIEKNKEEFDHYLHYSIPFWKMCYEQQKERMNVVKKTDEEDHVIIYSESGTKLGMI